MSNFKKINFLNVNLIIKVYLRFMSRNKLFFFLGLGITFATSLVILLLCSPFVGFRFLNNSSSSLNFAVDLNKQLVQQLLSYLIIPGTTFVLARIIFSVRQTQFWKRSNFSPISRTEDTIGVFIISYILFLSMILLFSISSLPTLIFIAENTPNIFNIGSFVFSLLFFPLACASFTTFAILFFKKKITLYFFIFTFGAIIPLVANNIYTFVTFTYENSVISYQTFANYLVPIPQGLAMGNNFTINLFGNVNGVFETSTNGSLIRILQSEHAYAAILFSTFLSIAYFWFAIVVNGRERK